MAQASTILIADDDETNRRLLGTYLRKQGFEIEAVGSGQEAIDAVKRGGIDLLLLDVMMPGMSGLDALVLIRQTHSAFELPIIMVTARSESEDVVAALELGANDYVAKPFDLPVLRARITARLRIQHEVRSSEGAAVSDDEPDLAHVRPGEKLQGRYLLEEKIGSGHYGTVYRGRHLGLDRPVAVKVLKMQRSDDNAEAFDRFRLEGVAACRIEHPNAVSVMDFGVTDAGVAYLVMEHLTGVPLSKVLNDNGAMSSVRARQIVMPICYVLAEAHARGMVHRDIKPANIFLHEKRGQEIVKVLDFGLAKFVIEEGEASKETGEKLRGTPAYMAPERVQSLPYDGRADVYALGVMLYEMLSGRTPFGADESDPIAVAIAHLQQNAAPLHEVADVNLEVSKVVHQAMARDPRDRPSVEMLAISFSQATRAF